MESGNAEPGTEDCSGERGDARKGSGRLDASIKPIDRDECAARNVGQSCGVSGRPVEEVEDSEPAKLYHDAFGGDLRRGSAWAGNPQELDVTTEQKIDAVHSLSVEI